MIKIDFLYGNWYEKLDTFTVTRGGNEVRHKWKAYVKMRDEHIKANKFISRVTFKLPELFEIEKVVKRIPPFAYECTGWGYFTMPIHIEWQKWLNKTTTVIDHQIWFENNGSHNIFTLKLDKQWFIDNFPGKLEDPSMANLWKKYNIKV